MEDKEPKQRIYEDLGLEGAGVSYESFSKKFDSDPEARKSVYKDLGLEQAGVDYQTFETKMFGEKKNAIGNATPTGGKVGASEIPSTGNETAELLGYKKPIQAPSPLIKQPDIAATPPTQQTKVIGEVVDNKNKIIATKTLTNLDEKQPIQPKVGVDKTALEDYNRTYDIYKNRDKWMSEVIQNDVLSHYVTSGGVLGDIVNVASGVISAPNYKKAEEDFKKTPAYAKLNGVKKKAENEFYAAKEKADKEVQAQSENIVNELGGWSKIVTENGNADVDKIREGVDSFLDKNGIPTDSPVAYKLRNEIKGKAEFKRIEPEIETQFDVEYKKAFGVTPEQDIQKEYGVKIEQAKTIKEAKIALEKQRAVQNEALKNEYKPEYEALGGQYKAKTEELNLAIENDPELNSFAQSLNNDVFQKYQAAVDSGQMTAEQANQEMNSPKNQDAVKAEVLKKVNEKYGKQYESAFTEYQKQINEVATRYNLAHRQQEERRVSEANQKIQSEVEKLKGQFKVSNELIERRKKAYLEAYKNVSEKQNLAKEAAGRSLNFTTQAGLSLLMGLGGGLKGYGAEFDNKTLYDIGESLESNFDIRVGESKDFSDWLDSSKLTVGTGNIIGRMVPGIALTAGAAALTKDWNLTSRLATTAVMGLVAETADMAGTVKNDVLEKTGDPAKADKAARDMWRSQIYILPLYALEGAPYIGDFYTQIGKKIAPKLFAEAAKGSRKTFGQWAKEAAAKSVGAGTAEVVTETLQEFPQNINEEAIRNGKEIGNIADQIDVYSEGASLKGLKETFVQIAPSTFLMGGTPVFVSDVYNGAKQKYYEKAVDNYVNSESISASLETSPEQYLFNVTADKGSNFAGTLLNTLYTSGKISEVEFDNLSQKMANMDAFNKLSKKAGMKEDKTSSLVGYRLYDQYLTANESFEKEQDPIAKEVLKAKADESKKNLTEYLQGSGVNVGIMTLANGQQFVFTPEELKFALQFENIRNSLKNKEIGLTITAKKGEENQSKQTIDELNEMLKEPVSVSEEIKKPVVEREEVVIPTVTLNKNTTPTEEKYGTIDRGDGKGIVDLTRAEYEAEVAKQGGVEREDVKPMVTEVQFTTKQRERRDQEIEEVQQLRSDLGQDVELINDIPAFVDDVVDRIDLGMMVAPEMLGDAIKELDKQFDKLQAYRNDPSRTHTTAQIDAMIDVLGAVKSEIQDYQIKQKENGQQQQTTATKTEPTTAPVEGVEAGKEQVTPTTEEEKGESSVPGKTDKAYQEAQGVTERISKAHPEASVLIIPKGDDLLLTALYVGKEKRGKGIGSGVLESVKAEADKLGKKVVLDATNELDSETDLERLGNFYERNGFEKVGENKFEYTPKEAPQAGSVGVGGEAGTSLRGVKYSDIIVDDKYLEDILSDNNLSEEEKKQVREVFARAVDYFKFDKEGEQKFQEKFANPEDITDVADIITGLSAAQQSAFNFYNTKNYENVKDAVNYIANNPNEYSPKVVKAVKEIKEKLDNPSSSMSRLYAIDVMKELGISEQSLKETPQAGSVGVGGDVNFTEVEDKKIKDIAIEANIKIGSYVKTIPTDKKNKFGNSINEYEVTNPFTNEKITFKKQGDATDYVIKEIAKATTKSGREEIFKAVEQSLKETPQAGSVVGGDVKSDELVVKKIADKEIKRQLDEQGYETKNKTAKELRDLYKKEIGTDEYKEPPRNNYKLKVVSKKQVGGSDIRLGANSSDRSIRNNTEKYGEPTFDDKTNEYVWKTNTLTLWEMEDVETGKKYSVFGNKEYPFSDIEQGQPPNYGYIEKPKFNNGDIFEVSANPEINEKYGNTTLKNVRKQAQAKAVEQSLKATPQATENEKITQEEDGQPLPEGVSSVRTETEERKTSAELRAEEKEVRSTIDNAVANFYAINEATKRSEKREAAKEFRQNLEKMPTVKNVFDNIKSIFAQLEAEGIITKSKDCP